MAPVTADGSKYGLVKRRLTRTDNACLVVAADTNRYLTAHPELTNDLLLRAFERLDLTSYRYQLRAEIDFGTFIGHTSKIETAPIAVQARTTFVRRKCRSYPSRVIVGLAKPLSSVLTIIAQRSSPVCFVLRTAYIGTLAPPEPCSINTFGKMKLDPAEALSFWCRNALVFDPQEAETPPFVSSWSAILAEADAQRAMLRMRRDADARITGCQHRERA